MLGGLGAQVGDLCFLALQVSVGVVKLALAGALFGVVVDLFVLRPAARLEAC